MSKCSKCDDLGSDPECTECGRFGVVVDHRVIPASTGETGYTAVEAVYDDGYVEGVAQQMYQRELIAWRRYPTDPCPEGCDNGTKHHCSADVGPCEAAGCGPCPTCADGPEPGRVYRECEWGTDYECDGDPKCKTCHGTGRESEYMTVERYDAVVGLFVSYMEMTIRADREGRLEAGPNEAEKEVVDTVHLVTASESDMVLAILGDKARTG